MQIHELNNYIGVLNENAFLVVDNGSDTGKLPVTNVTDPLNDRIDNIITSPAPTNEEIIDARLGVDGTVYDSLGDAIRGQVGGLEDELDDTLDIEKEVISVNKLDTNSAIGQTAGSINGHNYYFGAGITLEDYADYYSVITFCRTATDSINGLTAKWLYDDDTLSSSYITLNIEYRVDQIADKNRIVGIQFVAFSVGASLEITKLGVKFTGNTQTADEDTYQIGYKSNRLDQMEDTITAYEYEPINAIELTDGAGVLSIGGSYNTSSPNFMHGTGAVTPGAMYQITGRTFGASYPVYLWLDANDRILSYGYAGTAQDKTVTGKAPASASKVVVNYFSGHIPPEAILGTKMNIGDYIDERIADVEKNYWYGKKIVWFGTSIPAGVINAGDQEGEGSYPIRIGEMLGATVYNEARGSSAVRAGDHNSITANDPMGYGGMSAPGLMLSLSLSSSEKQTIFDNWESKWKDIITFNQELINVTDPVYTTMYKNASWDILLTKYLTGGSVGPCDLYVFDHGYNDGVKNLGFSDLSEVPATQTDRTYFLGAMAFLIDKILSDNPKAQICFIGHWSNDKGTGVNATKLVTDAQEKLANIWKYDLCKTWEKIGWSANVITSNGVTKPVYQFWCIDGVHPASDLTGEALQHYAETLFPMIRDVR